MGERLIAVIQRLSEDMDKLKEAMAHAQATLGALLRESRKNGKTQKEQLDTIRATQRFLANQQPRWDTTDRMRVHRPLENDDHD